MTFLVERLADLRRHLDHLKALGPQVRDVSDLEANLTLHNDVLFSLLTVCQLVIDISAELSARRAERFEDYREAIRNLSRDQRFSHDLVERLEPLAGFRNVLVHEYVTFDLRLAVKALRDLDPVERFRDIVAELVGEENPPGA